MSCCGQKREALLQRRTMIAPSRPPAPPRQRERLTYQGQSPYLVEGPVSREVYFFADENDGQLVDPADLTALVQSGLFRKE